jgi:hypothetical protein
MRPSTKKSLPVLAAAISCMHSTFGDVHTTAATMGLLGTAVVASALSDKPSLRRRGGVEKTASIAGTTTEIRSLAMDNNAAADRTMDSDHSASFQPLPCNKDLESDSPCALLWSEVFPTSIIDALTGPAKIKCGTCVKLDNVTGSVSIPTGLNIEGKLLIDSADYYSEGQGDGGVTIKIPFVLVQGILEIKSDRPVSPTDSTELVKIVLDDSSLKAGAEVLDLSQHVHLHNTDFCKMRSCSVGKKPIIVAGGKLDIEALPAACPSWTSLQDVETRPITIPDEGTYPSPAKLGPEQLECPADPAHHTLAGAVLDSVGFDSEAEIGFGKGEFNGHWATYLIDTADSHTPGNSYLRVTDRSATWQGPMVDMSDIIKCMVPGKLYILTAKVKLQPTEAFVPDEEAGLAATKCSAQGQSCVQAVLYKKRLDESQDWKGLGNNGTNVDSIEDNMWYDYSTIYRFTEEQLTPGLSHRLYTLKVQRPALTFSLMTSALPRHLSSGTPSMPTRKIISAMAFAPSSL